MAEKPSHDMKEFGIILEKNEDGCRYELHGFGSRHLAAILTRAAILLLAVTAFFSHLEVILNMIF